MNIDIQYFFKGCIITLFLGISSCSERQNISFSEKVSVSLREVGHHLLLANQDSTTLVKPVLTLDTLKYQLSFEEQLSIYPDNLVIYINNSFKKAGLPQDYLVEVLECSDKEVAYSYYKKQEKKGNKDIYCRNRELKKGCYLINVKFVKPSLANSGSSGSVYVLFLGIAILMAIVFTYFRKKSKSIFKDSYRDYESIGKYKFYPGQNKLIKEGFEISLSTKECELLCIFIAKPNHIIKRDELTKKVWEDNGVIVGRSLDTYISKLRKKLQEDHSVKLTNIHGVGYKLEF
ncbi:winged helix-turn-helix domain-containing protein [Flagellimonas sp. HMM57]|uniref:winged helix-turn-helix domain-containing protein n=1 Tax=unclassified Flagellimonas TaxID=2644544 RepID=UPI0013D046FD|nr:MULTISPECIES: winged helix-turn-helix domain-containing protein [unclassified Flagellimonas]UII75834.1 winged helix-turn-helix domain-containing protein [Flagellimonas sp. HMM57]